jgi:hypothetical protein
MKMRPAHPSASVFDCRFIQGFFPIESLDARGRAAKKLVQKTSHFFKKSLSIGLTDLHTASLT